MDYPTVKSNNSCDSDSMEYEIQQLEESLRRSINECNGILTLQSGSDSVQQKKFKNLFSEDENELKKINSQSEIASPISCISNRIMLDEMASSIGSVADLNDVEEDVEPRDTDDSTLIAGYEDDKDVTVVFKDKNTVSKTKILNSSPFSNVGSPQRFSFTTSTPFKSKIYVTPATSVLRKWRPSLIKRSDRSTIGNIGDISGIENIPVNEISKIRIDEDDESVLKEGDGFEFVMESLKSKMAELDEERELDCNETNCSKLERYHNTVVAQREEDDRQFEEILLELTNEISQLVDDKDLDMGELVDIGKNTENNNNKAKPVLSVSLEPIIEEDEHTICIDDEDDDDSTMSETIENKLVKSNDIVPLDSSSDIDKKSGAKLHEDIVNKKSVDEIKLAEHDIAKNDGEEIVIVESKRNENTEEGINLIKNDIDKNSLKEINVVESIAKKKEKEEMNLVENNGSLSEKDILVIDISDDDGEDYKVVEVTVNGCKDYITYKNSNDKTIDDVEAATEKVLSQETNDDVLSVEFSEKFYGVESQVKASAVSASTAHELKVTDVEAVKQEVKVILEEDFISHDPNENADNYDPEWEYLRNLKTDHERYKALRQRWHSVTIPDPNVDLCYQKFRVDSLSKIEGNVMSKRLPGSRKRPHASVTQEGPELKRRKCTLIFEQSIDDLLCELEKKRINIHQQMNKELKSLEYKQNKEYKQWNIKRRNYATLYKKQTREVENLKSRFIQQLRAAENHTAKCIDSLKSASDEIHTFHKFYDNLDSKDNNSGTMFLSENQVLELLEIEVMIEMFHQMY